MISQGVVVRVIGLATAVNRCDESDRESLKHAVLSVD